MNKLIWVKFYNSNYYQLMLRLNNIGITIYDNKKDKDDIFVKINKDDYEKIQKYLISYKKEISGLSGILKINWLIKKYLIFIIAIFFSTILLLFCNNLVFKIEIKNNNNNIQKLIKKELKKHNLTILKLKKSHKEIERIVNIILDNNKDTLEWLEIKYDGLVMIVNVTEKTIIKENTNYPYCHIIASSDAKILSLNLYRGVSLKEVNDYVIKGDIILSGDITYNEEVKNRVCASGEVYGEVWYKVKVEVPYKEEKIKYTGKNRYNFNIKFNDDTYNVFKSRIKNHKDQEINLYKLNDFEINLVKEKEYIIDAKMLTEEEAYNKALKLAIDNVQLKLDKDEAILVKKVLKKEVNDSTIYLEVFIITKENIGTVQIVEEEEIDGRKLNQ